MNNKNHLALILFFSLLVGCAQKGEEIDFVPGILYRVTTTEGEGFARFERMPDDQWHGVYYLNDGRLEAEARDVSLKSDGELTLTDITGNSIPIINYSRYEEPEFTDYPETWNYRDSVYAVSIKEDVVFGSAKGYWISYPDTGGTLLEIYEAKEPELDRGMIGLDLTTDIYIPDDNMVASRPLLVLIHQGAFFNGDKRDIGFPEMARYFAGRGYVVASVNYRLGFELHLLEWSTPVDKAGIRAVQDVDAAIRYITHHRDTFAVDSSRVFVAGASAGGITALNVAFMRDKDIPSGAKEEGPISSISPEYQVSYTIRAIGNMWGAVNDLSILNNNDTTSIISFHSTTDPVVPYGDGHPFKKLKILNLVLFPNMYGSERISKYLGPVRATLKSYADSSALERHSLHVEREMDEDGNYKLLSKLSPRFYEMESALCDYFSGVMLPNPVVPAHTDRSQVFQVMSPDIESVYWQVQGGVILKQSGCRAEVLLFSDVSFHSITVCGKYKSGLTYRHSWTL